MIFENGLASLQALPKLSQSKMFHDFLTNVMKENGNKTLPFHSLVMTVFPQVFLKWTEFRDSLFTGKITIKRLDLFLRESKNWKKEINLLAEKIINGSQSYESTRTVDNISKYLELMDQRKFVQCLFQFTE